MRRNILSCFNMKFAAKLAGPVAVCAVTAAVVVLTAPMEAGAGLPMPPAPNVNVRISGPVPAPPGVTIVTDDQSKGKHGNKHGKKKHHGKGRKLGHGK